jgi:hypothetical protein
MHAQWRKIVGDNLPSDEPQPSNEPEKARKEQGEKNPIFAHLRHKRSASDAEMRRSSISSTSFLFTSKQCRKFY